MEKVKFKDTPDGMNNCLRIINGIATTITPKECCAYINSRGVKCYGRDEQGYIVYSK